MTTTRTTTTTRMMMMQRQYASHPFVAKVYGVHGFIWVARFRTVKQTLGPLRKKRRMRRNKKSTHLRVHFILTSHDMGPQAMWMRNLPFLEEIHFKQILQFCQQKIHPPRLWKLTGSPSQVVVFFSPPEKLQALLCLNHHKLLAAATRHKAWMRRIPGSWEVVFRASDWEILSRLDVHCRVCCDPPFIWHVRTVFLGDHSGTQHQWSTFFL